MRITLDSIAYNIGSAELLKGVSAQLPSGSFTSILGPSGAGKSTLLSIIAGLVLQSSGRVLFDGECVDNLAAHERPISVVFQDARLFPHMSVSDNVAFPLKMQHVPKAERLKQASYYLELVQLKGFGGRRVQTLSGGQAQRVALARALAAEPNAVLLDEPFSGLDEHLRHDMRALVSELHEQLGMTMLMVTHDAAEACVMSDYVLSLSQGALLQSATPQDLILHPASEQVAASFGEHLSIEGVVCNQVFSAQKLTLPAAGIADGPALLVLRHEHRPTIVSLDD